MSRNVRSNNNIATVKSENKTISDPREMVETFNEHFVGIGPKLASNLSKAPESFKEYLTPVESSTSQLKPVDTATVLKLLKALPTRKATGLDYQIPCRLIREAAPADSSITKSYFQQIYRDWYRLKKG